jgi:hypothetical protein
MRIGKMKLENLCYYVEKLNEEGKICGYDEVEITSFREWASLNKYCAERDDEYDYSYILRCIESNDADWYMHHTDVMSLLKRYYEADIYDAEEINPDPEAYDTYGYFVVKNDKIVEFISCEYAEGIYDACMLMKPFVQGIVDFLKK